MATETTTSEKHTCDLCGREMAGEELLRLHDDHGHTVDVCPICRREERIDAIPQHWANQKLTA